MKPFLFLIFISVSTFAERLDGYFFTENGTDYITEKLGSTFPSYRIEWQEPTARKNLCFSSKAGECSSYSIRFKRETDAQGKSFFTKVSIVPWYDDVEAKSRFIKIKK